MIFMEEAKLRILEERYKETGIYDRNIKEGLENVMNGKLTMDDFYKKLTPKQKKVFDEGEKKKTKKEKKAERREKEWDAWYDEENKELGTGLK